MKTVKRNSPSRSRRAVPRAAMQPEMPAGPKNEVTIVLRLFVTGSTVRSLAAVQNLKKFCDQNDELKYALEVVDLYKEPHAAIGEQIIAAPTLVRKDPPPMKRFIGDLSDFDRLRTELIGRSDSNGKAHRARRKKTL